MNSDLKVGDYVRFRSSAGWGNVGVVTCEHVDSTVEVLWVHGQTVRGMTLCTPTPSDDRVHQRELASVTREEFLRARAQ